MAPPEHDPPEHDPPEHDRPPSDVPPPDVLAPPSPPPRGARAAWVLTKKTVLDAADDRIIGVSAEVAFFALLAIPPMLLVLATLAGAIADLIGPEAQATVQHTVITALGGFLAEDATEGFVVPTVEGIFGGESRGGLISVGLILALWSASRLIKVLIEAMNIAYDVGEWRSAWKRRVLALGLMLGGVLAVLVYVPFVVAGPKLGAAIDDWTGLEGVFSGAWNVLYWPLAALIGISILTTLYHVAPNWRTPWRRDLPGAILAATIWVVAAFALRVYVSVAISESGFGPLAAPVVLLLWLYVLAFAVLLGAELNAEIEKLWPSPDARPKVRRARFLSKVKR